MNEEVRGYLDKADHALAVAQDMITHGHSPDAASKVYYAMFYAAKALLASEDSRSSNIPPWKRLLAIILPNRDGSTPSTTVC